MDDDDYHLEGATVYNQWDRFSDDEFIAGMEHMERLARMYERESSSVMSALDRVRTRFRLSSPSAQRDQLRKEITSLEKRLLYIQHGIQVVADNLRKGEKRLYELQVAVINNSAKSARTRK